MNEPIRLPASSVLENPPFTHPEHSVTDWSIVNIMIERLRAPLRFAMGPAPLHVPWDDLADMPHRIVIGNPPLLWNEDDFELVGFFGQRRADADPGPVALADELLLGEFRYHPGMIVYISYQLPCTNFGNLVIFGSAKCKSHWSQSEQHAHVAREIAPTYYDSIRLHNGTLPGGLIGGLQPVLTSTKYLDYSNAAADAPWRAERSYGDAQLVYVETP